MKYRELYSQGMEKLSSENMSDAKTDARLLLEFACKTDRNALFLQGDMEVAAEDERAYLELIEKRLKHIEAIIQSMTKQERRNPKIIGASRKVRIAKGSGTKVEEVNRLLKQFEDMKKMMKQFSGPKQAKMLKRMRKFR